MRLGQNNMGLSIALYWGGGRAWAEGRSGSGKTSLPESTEEGVGFPASGPAFGMVNE